MILKTFSVALLIFSLFLFIQPSSSFAQRLSDIGNQNETASQNVINATSEGTATDVEAPATTTGVGNQQPSSPASANATAAQNPQQQQLNPQILLDRLQMPIVGSFGDDRISGTQEPDVIIGFLGSDTVTGMNGSDAIQGNEGQDKLYGNEGEDILQGGIGSDQIYGDVGDDILAAGGDDDFLSGEQGNDKMYGDVGDDILVGGAGADYFDCGEGVDVVADFNLQEADDRAGNCEELIEQSPS